MNQKLARIDDYTSGMLDDAFEEELFAEAAEGRADELVFVDMLHRVAPWFRPRGGFVGGVTRAKLEELRAAPHVHYIEIPVDQPHAVAAWPADTRLVVYKIDVDLRGYDRVDVVACRPDGTLVKTFRDVACDPNDGAIYAVCDEPLARASFRGGSFVSRIEATRDGKREVVATVQTQPG